MPGVTKGETMTEEEQVIKLDGPGPFDEMKLVYKMPVEGERESSPVYGLLRGPENRRHLRRIGRLTWDGSRGRYVYSSDAAMTSGELKRVARWIDGLGRL